MQSAEAAHTLLPLPGTHNSQGLDRARDAQMPGGPMQREPCPPSPGGRELSPGRSQGASQPSTRGATQSPQGVPHPRPQ